MKGASLPWTLSGFHLFIISRSVRPSRLLRDEKDGRGDKEPVPPPSRLPFVALSPSLLVTHDYALSTGEQVLLFACNSMTISVNLRWAPNVVHTACPLTVFYIWLAYTDAAWSPLCWSCLYIYSVYKMSCCTYTLLIIIYIFHVNKPLGIIL